MAEGLAGGSEAATVCPPVFHFAAAASPRVSPWPRCSVVSSAPVHRRAQVASLETGWAGHPAHPTRRPPPRLCHRLRRVRCARARACASSLQQRAASSWRQAVDVEAVGRAPRRCSGQASRADQPAGAWRALGGHSAGNGTAAHHERRDGHQPPQLFISVEAGRCELEARRFRATQKCR